MQIPSHLRITLETLATNFKRSELESASRNISERYRRIEKNNSSLGIISQAEAMAYGATRLPATYSSAIRALEELKTSLPSFSPSSVLDIGSGPATACFAAIESWPDIENLTLVEQNKYLLQLGTNLLNKSYNNINATWQKSDVTSLDFNKLNQHDLVLCAYVLNEIAQEKGNKAFRGGTQN